MKTLRKKKLVLQKQVTVVIYIKNFKNKRKVINSENLTVTLREKPHYFSIILIIDTTKSIFFFFFFNVNNDNY
jgi:hypothetical protein